MQPSLHVYILWHPRSQPAGFLAQLADKIFTLLRSQPEKPFVRGMGIATFFRFAPWQGEITKPIDLNSAQKSVVFPLVDEFMVDDPAWGNFIYNLFLQAKNSRYRHRVIPIGLTANAKNLHSGLENALIPALDKVDGSKLESHLLWLITHELARHIIHRFSPTQVGTTPVKLFISHTKRDGSGRAIAEAFKKIVEKSTIDKFFDEVNIAPGEDLNQAILAGIEHSSVLAIRTDRYAESPWCQLEVLEAKKHHRPMVILDALHESEERNFPYLGNIPAIRLNWKDGLSDEENTALLEPILKFVMEETLRFVYTQAHLAHLQETGILPPKLPILPRPPEERDIREHTSSSITTLVYADPPLSSVESHHLQHPKVKLATPTTLFSSSLQGLTVGISISKGEAEEEKEELNSLGLSALHLNEAAIAFTRHCLTCGGKVAYGGDLRLDGFTQLMVEMLQAEQAAGRLHEEKMVNYQAWPIHLNTDISWTNKHKNVLKIIKLPPPADLIAKGTIDPNIFLPPDSAAHAHIWSRCLTAMRLAMRRDIHARIVLGGRWTGYKGRYPGVAEEILLSMQIGQPVFLLGGFGGVSQMVAKALLGQPPKQLTLDGQICDMPSYKERAIYHNLQCNSNWQDCQPIDYPVMVKFFAQKGVAGLKNGLSRQENLTLFATDNLDVALYLVMKGLAKLAKKCSIPTLPQPF